MNYWKNLLKILLIITVFFSPHSAIADCSQCGYQRLSDTRESEGMRFDSKTSDYRIQYNGKSDSLKTLSMDNNSCEFEIGVVVEVYLADKEPLALVMGRSANSHFAQMLNIETCTEVGESIALSQNAEFNGKQLTVPPSCECADPEKEDCLCSEASIYEVSSDCLLARDVAASRALTERELNVAFEGAARVSHPGDRNAKIIE